MNASHQKVLRPKALLAALLAVPTLSACGVNFGAQTDQVYTPGDGENSGEGTVSVLHALIVTEEPGTGRLIAGLANKVDQDDALVDVAGAGEDQDVDVQMEEIEVPANGFVQLADLDEAVLVTGEEDAIQPGTFVRVTFSFDGSDSVELNVPVLAPGADYADVEIPEATGGSTGTPTAEPSSTPTDEPTENPEG